MRSDKLFKLIYAIAVLVFIVALCLVTSVSFAQAQRLVCFGDSVTLGRGVASDQSFCSRLGASIRSRTVVNSGIGGNNTRQARERFQRDVLDHTPTVVTIMFGLNDSFVEPGKSESRIPVTEYEEHLTYFVKQLKRRGVRVILATSNCTANAWENHDLRPYVEVVRRLSERLSVQLVDVYTLTAQLQVEGANLYTDRVHPNAELQEAIAQEFMRGYLNRRLRR